MSLRSKLPAVFIGILLAGIVLIFAAMAFLRDRDASPQNFAGCLEAGYPIMESFPRQCRMPDGRVFAEETDMGELQKRETVKARVTDILVNQNIIVLGKSRRNVIITIDTKLLGRNGNPIALRDILPGFTVRVEGMAYTDGSIKAEKVTVLANPSVVVFMPPSGGTVLSSFTVRGATRLATDRLSYAIEADDGTVLKEGIAGVAAGTGYREFTFMVTFEPAVDTGKLLIRVPDAPDNGLVIPLRFSGDIDGPSVKVYFSNTVKDPDMLSCETVYSVNRKIDRATDAPRIAIEKLLAGPLPDEKEQGFLSSIPEGVALLSLDISDDGVATVDFSEEMNESAGSCMVTAIRSQITRTLLQFPSVREVRILVEGNEEEALQP